MENSISKINQGGRFFKKLKPGSNILFGGLLLFFILEYVRPVGLQALKLGTIVPVSVFVLTFISRMGRSNSEILTAKNTKWLLLFIALFLIQVFTADVTLYVFKKFVGVVGYLLTYFVIVKQVTSIQKIRMVFSVLTFVHVILIFMNPKLVLSPEVRNVIEGVTFLGDGNDFSWSACIVIPMSLFLAQTTQSKIQKFTYLGIFIFLVLAVVSTQSRGGSIAMVITIIYLVMKAKRKAVGLVAIVTVSVIVLLFAPKVYFDRMGSIIEYEADGSAQGRINAWKSAFRMALDNPLTGVGAGHFPVAFGTDYRPSGVGRTEMPWLNAHSIYFLALGEFGFTGIVFLLGLIITNMIRNEKIIATNAKLTGYYDNVHKLAITMQASFIGFAIGGAFLSGLYYPHIFIISALNECVWYLSGKR